MSNLPVYLLTLLAYGVLSVIYARAQLTGRVERAVSVMAGNAVLIPLLLHGYVLYAALWVNGGLHLGLVNAVSLIFWLTILIYWVAHFFYPLSSLKALMMPLAGGAAMLPLLFPAVRNEGQPTSWIFDAHVLAAMLAYSLFTIAALHASLMSLVESNLHKARLPLLLRNLPPLLTMETLLFRLIGIGFVLLTVTLVSGALFSEQIFGKPFQFTHKILFGIVSWLVFGILLAGRHLRGWRGKTAVSWTMWGFGFLLLAYLGSQFVLEVILHR